MGVCLKKVVRIIALVTVFMSLEVAVSADTRRNERKQIQIGEMVSFTEKSPPEQLRINNNQQAAEVAYNLSIAAANRNDLTLARTLIEEAIQLNHLNLDYLAFATDIAFVKKEYDKAEEYQVMMLLVARSTLGLNDLQVAVILDQLAVINMAQEHYEEARYRLKEGLQLRERMLGDNHLLIILSLNKLALLAIGQKLPTIAEPLLKRSLDIARKVSGPHHSNSAVLLAGLADFYQSEGRLEEAEVHYKEAISIWVKSPHDQSSRLISQNSLGELFMNQQRFDDARLQFEEVLFQLKQYYKKDHPYIQQAIENIALLDAEHKRNMEQKLIFDELVRLLSFQMSHYKGDETNITPP